MDNLLSLTASDFLNDLECSLSNVAIYCKKNNRNKTEKTF